MARCNRCHRVASERTCLNADYIRCNCNCLFFYPSRLTLTDLVLKWLGILKLVEPQVCLEGELAGTVDFMRKRFKDREVDALVSTSLRSAEEDEAPEVAIG